MSGPPCRNRRKTSHSPIPTLSTVNIPYERSSADLVRHTLVSCGTNEQVVSVAAVRPSVVTASMLSDRVLGANGSRVAPGARAARPLTAHVTSHALAGADCAPAGTTGRVRPVGYCPH